MVTEYFFSRGGQFLLVPYCARGSLKQNLFGNGSGLPDFRDRLKIARGLAAGLAHLHARRVNHHDVRPKNVLLAADFEPRLTNYCVPKAEGFEVGGSASDAAAPCTSGAGALGYAAPELGRCKCGPKTDVYAAGVVLLQLATGMHELVEDGLGGPPGPLRDFLMRAETGVPALASPGTAVRAEALASVARIADPACAWPAEVLAGLVALGLRCTEGSPAFRPAAAEMVLILADVAAPNGGPSHFGARPDLLPGASALLCSVCEDELRDVALAPCRHAVACAKCAEALERCPFCHAAVEGRGSAVELSVLH